MIKTIKNADIRFNGGDGALLCNKCQTIIKYGFEHEDIEYYCNNCIKEKLNFGKVLVTFTKVDGTKRVMMCTTNSYLIPEEKHPKKEFPISEEVQRVYDLDKQDWRSFRFDSVIGVK